MIRIVEVGPRDGLQNESTPIPTDMKLRFIERLRDAGLNEIEATSFVSPKWVPQLADAAELVPALPPGPTYWVLAPNLKGLERALAAGATNLAFFTAASDAFTQKNINMSVDESLAVFEQMKGTAGVTRWRAYVSTAFECPYAGRIEPGTVAKIVERLLEIGAEEISLGDTIGVASPHEVKKLTKELEPVLPKERWAYHFHDTRGTAVANVAEALSHGITCFDSSAGGLGGCPYAPGAGGNLATEDLVYFLTREGLTTSVDLERLAHASLEVLAVLGRAPSAKAQLPLLARAPSSPR